MKKLVIIGVGETADIAYEYFTHDSEYEVVAFAVEKQYKEINTYYEKPVVEIEEIENIYPKDEYKVYVALSSGKLNRNRTKLYNIVKNKGYKFASYISSKAFVWHNVEIGENTFIFENNVIQHKVKIGNNVILWSGNHIGHQTEIKDNVFISSHCVISGYCQIGENSFLGVNSTFADHVKIGRDCFIGAGSLVNKNLEDNSFVRIKRADKSEKGSREMFGVDKDEN